MEETAVPVKRKRGRPRKVVATSMPPPDMVPVDVPEKRSGSVLPAFTAGSPPAKRPRLSSAVPRANMLKFSDEKLEAKRKQSQSRLLEAWDNILSKYASVPLDDDDEIDIFTGRVAVDRGRLMTLEGRPFGERVAGNVEECDDDDDDNDENDYPDDARPLAPEHDIWEEDEDEDDGWDDRSGPQSSEEPQTMGDAEDIQEFLAANARMMGKHDDEWESDASDTGVDLTRLGKSDTQTSRRPHFVPITPIRSSRNLAGSTGAIQPRATPLKQVVTALVGDPTWHTGDSSSLSPQPEAGPSRRGLERVQVAHRALVSASSNVLNNGAATARLVSRKGKERMVGEIPDQPSAALNRRSAAVSPENPMWTPLPTILASPLSRLIAQSHTKACTDCLGAGGDRALHALRCPGSARPDDCSYHHPVLLKRKKTDKVFTAPRPAWTTTHSDLLVKSRMARLSMPIANNDAPGPVITKGKRVWRCHTCLHAGGSRSRNAHMCPGRSRPHLCDPQVARLKATGIRVDESSSVVASVQKKEGKTKRAWQCRICRFEKGTRATYAVFCPGRSRPSKCDPQQAQLNAENFAAREHALAESARRRREGAVEREVGSLPEGEHESDYVTDDESPEDAALRQAREAFDKHVAAAARLLLEQSRNPGVSAMPTPVRPSQTSAEATPRNIVPARATLAPSEATPANRSPANSTAKRTTSKAIPKSTPAKGPQKGTATHATPVHNSTVMGTPTSMAATATRGTPTKATPMAPTSRAAPSDSTSVTMPKSPAVSIASKHGSAQHTPTKTTSAKSAPVKTGAVKPASVKATSAKSAPVVGRPADSAAVNPPIATSSMAPVATPTTATSKATSKRTHPQATPLVVTPQRAARPAPTPLPDLSPKPPTLVPRSSPDVPLAVLRKSRSIPTAVTVTPRKTNTTPTTIATAAVRMRSSRPSGTVNPVAEAQPVKATVDQNTLLQQGQSVSTPQQRSFVSTGRLSPQQRKSAPSAPGSTSPESQRKFWVSSPSTSPQQRKASASTTAPKILRFRLPGEGVDSNNDQEAGANSAHGHPSLGMSPRLGEGDRPAQPNVIRIPHTPPSVHHMQQRTPSSDEQGATSKPSSPLIIRLPSLASLRQRLTPPPSTTSTCSNTSSSTLHLTPPIAKPDTRKQLETTTTAPTGPAIPVLATIATESAAPSRPHSLPSPLTSVSPTEDARGSPPPKSGSSTQEPKQSSGPATAKLPTPPPASPKRKSRSPAVLMPPPPIPIPEREGSRKEVEKPPEPLPMRRPLSYADDNDPNRTEITIVMGSPATPQSRRRAANATPSRRRSQGDNGATLRDEPRDEFKENPLSASRKRRSLSYVDDDDPDPTEVKIVMGTPAVAQPRRRAESLAPSRSRSASVPRAASAQPRAASVQPSVREATPADTTSSPRKRARQSLPARPKPKTTPQRPPPPPRRYPVAEYVEPDDEPWGMDAEFGGFVDE